LLLPWLLLLGLLLPLAQPLLLTVYLLRCSSSAQMLLLWRLLAVEQLLQQLRQLQQLRRALLAPVGC
jgi:hypothetical protein